uniref:Putative secreted protein n=1 Tax=Anopheles darlingi TaxID=43151 RepID=A0A2M4DC32_ANODA
MTSSTGRPTTGGICASLLAPAAAAAGCPSAVSTGALSTSTCSSFCFSFSSSRSSLILRSSSLMTSILVLLSILPSRSPIAAFVTVATESGSEEMVAFSLSLVVMFSGSIRARESNSNDGGTFSFKLRLIHSCS